MTGEKGLAAIIALSASFLVMMSPNILSVLTNMVPWLTLLVIFLFLTFFIIRMFAGDDSDLFSSLIRQSTVYWILLVILILIIIVSFSQTYGQPLLDEQLPQETQTYTENGELIVTIDNTAGRSDTIQIVNGNDPTTSTTTDDFSTNVLNTIIHPKVLGMLMLLLIAFFSIIFLAKNKDPDNK